MILTALSVRNDLLPQVPDYYLPMSAETPQGIGRRPGIITLLSIVITLAAIVQLIVAVIGIVLALRPGEAQSYFGHATSDWVFIINGILGLLLALIYFWIARRLFAGDPQAWVLVNILALINLLFALFQIPFGTGWGSLILNGIVLLLNNTPKVRHYVGADANIER